MAKLKEELVAIKLSRLHKDNEAPANVVSDELAAQLAEIVEQLVGDSGVIVEIVKE